MTGQLATDTTLALGYCTASTYLFIEVSIMFICKCFNVIVGLPVYLYNLISLYFLKIISLLLLAGIFYLAKEIEDSNFLFLFFLIYYTYRVLGLLLLSYRKIKKN